MEPFPTLSLNQSVPAFLCIFSLNNNCCSVDAFKAHEAFHCELECCAILSGYLVRQQWAQKSLHIRVPMLCKEKACFDVFFLAAIFPDECSMPRALLILVQQQIPKYSRKLIHHQTLFRVGSLCSNRRVT